MSSLVLHIFTSTNSTAQRTTLVFRRSRDLVPRWNHLNKVLFVGPLNLLSKNVQQLLCFSFTNMFVTFSLYLFHFVSLFCLKYFHNNTPYLAIGRVTSSTTNSRNFRHEWNQNFSSLNYILVLWESLRPFAVAKIMKIFKLQTNCAHFAYFVNFARNSVTCEFCFWYFHSIAN